MTLQLVVAYHYILNYLEMNLSFIHENFIAMKQLLYNQKIKISSAVFLFHMSLETLNDRIFFLNNDFTQFYK